MLWLFCPMVASSPQAMTGRFDFWSADGNAGRVVSLGFPLNALALGPDGAIWVAGADGHLRAFDLAGALLREIDVDAVPLVSLAVSPKSRQLAAGAVDGQISIVYLARGEVSVTIETGGSPVWSLAFDAETGAADGRRAGQRRARLGPRDRRAARLAYRTMADARERAGAHDVFRACAACHSLTADDGRRAGPTLHGLFGRRIATARGFDYSAAVEIHGHRLVPRDGFELFDLGPAAYTPGTRMPEQRIPNADDRDALIDFLRERTGG